MKMLTKLTITVVLIVYIISTFFVLFLNHLNTDNDFRPSDDNSLDATLTARQRYPSALRQPVIDPKDDPITIDGQMRHTFWFLQISDLHVSIHFDPKRAPDLEKFCEEYIDIIKPSVVLATGDLTDARTKSPMGSRVHEEEWIMYWNALNKTKVGSRTVWLDIKGNHDNFNVYDWSHRNNFFKKYSIRGPNNTRSYKHSVRHDTETYSFIGVDACLAPSPKRPFNFIGLLRDKDIEAYGPYLCGHYHTVGGLVQHMYSTQPTGYLEIEEADWKDLRTIRLAAVDHGLFTFIDFKFNEWPVILITNPKDSLYSMPNIEPSHRTANSTHVRALVFSKSRLSSVEFTIDGNKWVEMKHISGPLYVHEWQPKDFNSGLHWIEVTATDTDDNKRTVKHQFSLDGSKGDFDFGARLMLRIDNRALGYFLFGLAISICVIPLIALRMIPNNKSPWFVGYVLDDYIGVCFVWGMIIDGSYLPGGITYILGTLVILFSLNFYFAYGLMAYLLGFFNTWSYVVYIILWHQSVGLSAHSFPEPIRPKYRKTVEFDDRKETQSLTRPPIRK
ncbi:unnamed protein product [Medioppia subpectinata]|uniref:Calcineurin-like phosphoesterase domain-containing protein n=1 Tax=Medioppia subpectinata TaxID=1979941 RepID=A0A7R9Q106_9ACAR|nr:unnamed protein product [Medioppia subpectinata]CAG2108561.1 unnamed protein product [Medioppia subpectinata]